MMLTMFGTVLNVLGILIGSAVGLGRRRPLEPASDSFFKVMLGAFTVYYGLRLTWLSVAESALLPSLKNLLITVVALMLGKMTGRLLGLQRLSNSLGKMARDRITAAHPSNPDRLNEGFKVCAALFCAAPLGILGAVQDGLSGYFFPLAVKAVMEGLATMGFVALFGWGVALSALPVLAVQGSISLFCLYVLKPFLERHELIDPVNAAGGLIVFSVALVILGLKKIELADYLPSLVFAGLLGWIFL